MGRLGMFRFGMAGSESGLLLSVSATTTALPRVLSGSLPDPLAREARRTVWKITEASNYSRASRNSAIFPGSFGITTGWLLNVNASASPPGVSI